MGILNSVALGKSRKSAGNITFYNRLGVGCFRQKPSANPSYRPSVAQSMQQKVFKFFKANVDASAIQSLLKLTFDAKNKAGKSQTMYNMFYKSFMPHIVAQKSAIYGLSEEDLVSPSLFLGAAGSHNDAISKGVLGLPSVVILPSNKFSIDAAILDEMLNKANTMSAHADSAFTINDLFVSIVSGKAGSQNAFNIVYPTHIKPTLNNAVYEFDLSTIVANSDTAVNIYAIITIAHSKAGALDTTKRYFSTDSFLITAEGKAGIQATARNASIETNTIVFRCDTSDLEDGNFNYAEYAGKELETKGFGHPCKASVSREDDLDTKVVLTPVGEVTVSNAQLVSSQQAIIKGLDGLPLITLTNSVTWEEAGPSDNPDQL